MRPLNTPFFYISAIVAAAAALVAVLFSDISWDNFPQMALFIVLIVVASFLIIQDPSGGVVSSTGTLFYVVLYVFNPITALVIVALGYSIGNTLPRSWVTWRTFFNGAQMGLSVFLGGLAYGKLGGNTAAGTIASQLIPAFAGALIHQVANNFFIAFLISKLRNLRFFRTWMNFIRELLWSNLLSVPTAILIAILYVRVHHAFVLMFLLSLPFQRWALRLYLEKRNTYARIVEHLVRAGEMSLPGSGGHAQRVANLASAIGRRLGLAERDVEAVGYAALLHDIGMIGMDDQIISKEAESDPKPLVEAHVRLGAEIVGDLGRTDLAEMVLHHHAPYIRDRASKPEAWVQPSIGARILALSEEVDSRLHGLFPYQDPAPLESIRRRLEEGLRGSDFDPQVVDAFLTMVREREHAPFELGDAEVIPAEG
ncbi:MAG TPA: HD domain-containing protein [bacterium]|jgi:putative nucleotidyltransferase with HDIG domain|nr:HD domain-containing protein [bacterium]